MQNKFLEKVVLAGLLTFTCAQPIWAQEGVDQPFTSSENIKNAISNAVNGKLVINSGSLSTAAKGIYVNNKNFVYTYTPVKMDVNGFVGSSGTVNTTSALYTLNGSLELARLELNFVDNTNVATNLRVSGIENADASNIKLGDGSTINVSGATTSIMNGIFAGNETFSNIASDMTLGNGLTINVKNSATGLANGIIAQGSPSIKIGSNFKLNVSAVGEATGIEITDRGSKVTVAEDANITVNSENGSVIGVNVRYNSFFEAGQNLNVEVHADGVGNSATGITLTQDLSKAILNGGRIVATRNNGELGRSITAYAGSELIANAGKYYIVGDINSSYGGKLSLDANDASYIKGGITETFIAGSDANNGMVKVKITEGSLWELTENSDMTALVSDNSTIDMRADGNIFSNLKVKNLSGDNGLIKMDIDAKKSVNNSDKIYVTNSFTGTQYLDLYEKNSYMPVGNEGVGTVLATVKDGDGKFLAKDGEGTLYWNRYELDKKATSDTSGNYTTDWYLKGIEKTVDPTTSVKAIRSAVNYHTWRNENDKLLKRMGELRLNGEDVEGLWVRMQGAKIGRYGNFGFENQYKSYELGYDKKVVDNEKLTRYQGAAFTYTDGKSSYQDGNGDNSSKSLSFYSTDIGAKGHYLDLVFKVSDMDNDFKVYDTNSKKITGDMSNIGISMSAEYGRKNDLSSGWYIEPQAQFTLGYLGGDSYTTSNGIKVDQSGIKSAVGRVGFNIGKEVGKQGIIYAKANLLHEFGGSYDVNMREGVETLKTSDGFNDTWFEYGIGAAFATSKTGQVYFDVERSTGSDFKKDWQWNVGARWTF